MTDNLQKDIEYFLNYFKNQLSEIEELKTSHDRLYRSLLYVTVLDTLAKSVLPKRKGNREKYVYFIKRFCKWPDAEKVSLVHLVQLLKKNPDPVYENLRKMALERFNKLSVHGSYLMPISDDLEFNEVKKYWPSAKEHRLPIDGISLESLQHCNLLYTYRNSLVHEMRLLGKGIEFSDDNEPFYHQMSKLDKNHKIDATSIELVYPWRFLHTLCERSLESLNEYCHESKLNPLESFNFGTYWLEQLN